jgi:hypothetical protein
MAANLLILIVVLILILIPNPSPNLPFFRVEKAIHGDYD